MPALTTTELMNCLSVKLVIVDEQQRILYANGATAALFDQEALALHGQPFPFDLHTQPPIVQHTRQEKTYYLRLETQSIDWEGTTATLVTLHDVTREEYLKQEVANRDYYFQVLMKNAPDMVAAFDNRGILRYINPAMERMLGYSVEESIGQSLVKFFRHRSASSPVRILTGLPPTLGERTTGQVRVVHRDGSLRLLNTTVTCTLDPNGERIYIANCEDITEIVAQRAVLQESEYRFQKLFHTVPYPFLLVRMRDWIIVETNDHPMLGTDTSLTRMIGKSLDEIEAEIPEYRVLRQELLRAGRLDNYEVSINQPRFQGWISVYGEIVDYLGEPTVLVSFVDITPYKQVQAELARLYDATSYLFRANSVQELANSIVRGIVKEFQQVDCGLMLVSEQGQQLVRVARAGEYGIDLDDAISVNGAGLVPQSFREGHPMYAPDVSKDESYVANVPTTRSEFVIPLKSHSGTIGVLDFQSQSIDGFSQSDRRLLKVFSERAAAALENMKLHDAVQQQALMLEQRVAERTEELSAALEKQRELLGVKTRFVSMISHEYRTPLTVIASSTSILQRYGDRLEAQKRAHHLQKIQQQVEKLDEMINAVVQINRAETVGVEFKPEAVDASALLQDIVLKFQAKNQTPLLLEIEGQEQPVTLDVHYFRLIAEHLISNALKYSPEDRPVRCRLGYQGDRLMLQVADEGIGIPPDDRNKIFSNFHRASNVGQIPGTGLGLPIVRQAVEAHNGRLHVQSAVGEGTVFTVTLPTEQV